MQSEQQEGGVAPRGEPWVVFGIGVVGMVVCTYLVLLPVVSIVQWFGQLILSRFQAPFPEMGFRVGLFAVSVAIVVGAVAMKLFTSGELFRSVRGAGDAFANEWGGQNLGAEVDLFVRAAHQLSAEAEMKPPNLYLLPKQRGINAFSAGLHHDHSVIVVTSGALSELSLEELRGVLAQQIGFIATGDCAAGFAALRQIRALRTLWSAGSWVFYRVFVEPQETRERAALSASGSEPSYKHLSSDPKNRGGGGEVEAPTNHVAYSLSRQGRQADQKLALKRTLGAGTLMPFVPVAALICLAGAPGYLASRFIQHSFGRIPSERGDRCAEELLGQSLPLVRVLQAIVAHRCGSKIFGRRGGEIAHLFFADYESKSLRAVLPTHQPLPERLADLVGEGVQGEARV